MHLCLYLHPYILYDQPFGFVGGPNVKWRQCTMHNAQCTNITGSLKFKGQVRVIIENY